MSKRQEEFDMFKNQTQDLSISYFHEYTLMYATGLLLLWFITLIKHLVTVISDLMTSCGSAQGRHVMIMTS